jgi:hypothetical protein
MSKPTAGKPLVLTEGERRELLSHVNKEVAKANSGSTTKSRFLKLHDLREKLVQCR